VSAARASSGGPRHFHLLWDGELEQLRPILKRVSERLHEVIGHWYQLYLLHFGEQRTLSEREFHEIFYTSLKRNTADLLDGDMDRYALNTVRTGGLLSERRVPFSEVIVSFHLYEESARTVFPEPVPIELFTTFDKLSHVRTILLADSYFPSAATVAGGRIESHAREARQLPYEHRRGFHGLMGSSPVMRRLHERIEAAGATRGTVLIVGESGTGKELVARAICECAPDPAAPFVALNCAAIPKDLIESELFGYKRGAFSGANADYLGLFRAAENGAVFLDEVTEMSAETQSKLLRAVQERMVRPVGSTREVEVDVRVMASTNRDPEEAVRQGLLRPDLYYRLQVSVLQVPPLRERSEDIPVLAEHFITLLNENLRPPRVPVHGVEPQALEAMQRYRWPGNVRELSNAIEGAFTFGRAPLIRLADLPPAVNGSATSDASNPLAQAPIQQPGAIVGSFADTERDLLRRALENTGGNKVAAARLLRISRKKLYAKIAKYGL
jgi:DNA-binding NtrC family response regulator